MKKSVSLALSAIFAISAWSAGDVLATVNGKKITLKEANIYLQKMNANAPFQQLKDEDKKAVLDQVIERELLKEQAFKDKVDQNPEFKKALEETKSEIALSFWMQKEFEKMTVSDNDAKAFYDKEKDKFKIPASFKASHILVKTEDEAKTLIKELMGKKLPEFRKVALEKSIDPSAKQNSGDLGWFLPNQMVKPFSDATAKLKVGEMTLEPVKTDFGYHVIYLEEAKAEGIAPYEQAKGQIVQHIKMTNFREVIAKKAQDLRKKAKIVVEAK